MALTYSPWMPGWMKHLSHYKGVKLKKRISFDTQPDKIGGVKLKKRISFWIPLDLLERAKIQAKKEGRTLSNLIRVALESRIRNQ